MKTINNELIRSLTPCCDPSKRKVLFKKWIPRVEEKTRLGTQSKEGTNCWEKDFISEGIFHEWANACEESSAGFGNFTVALVELADGTITEVLPINIRFVEPLSLS